MFTEVAPHRFEPRGRLRRGCRRCYESKRQHPLNHYTHARPLERVALWPYVLTTALIAFALLLWVSW